MKVRLSEVASNAMLDTLSSLLDGGSIELLTSEGEVLAVLKLADPAAEVFGPELVFNRIAEEDAALAQGNAEAARVAGADGQALFGCDVGDINSDAVIKLNTTRIFRGGPVRLSSFRLMF